MKNGDQFSPERENEYNKLLHFVTTVLDYLFSELVSLIFS